MESEVLRAWAILWEPSDSEESQPLESYIRGANAGFEVLLVRI